MKHTKYLSIPVLLLLSIGFTKISFGQVIQQVPISQQGTVESTNCDEYLILTDSNPTGNYGSNESFQITMCINTIEAPPVQVEILPTNTATGNVWDVDQNSTLFIYEGTGTTGNLLGAFNSVSDPNGVFFTTSSTCVTFVFNSGNASSGAGFLATIRCVQPLQPFDFELVPQSPFEFSAEEFQNLEGQNVVTICYLDSISFDALLNFPLSDATGNGYLQTIATTNLTWDWGDGDVDQGLGLTANGHVYEPFGGFFVRVTAEDAMGRIEKFEFFVLVAPRPLFSGILFGDTLCAGDTTQLTGGILEFDTVGVAPSTGLVNINYDFTGSRFLPDGNGETYNTSIDIFGYEDDPIITDPGDFVGICVNIEHTYLGDQECWLTCPNGSTALLWDGFGGIGGYGGVGFGGGGTYLGDANDDNSLLEGIGFDYCFSDDNATLGTMADEFAAGNTIPVSTFQPGNAMVSGTYLPAESFTNFIGCPLNGEWILTFRDNIGADNGYIFNWSLEFSSEFMIDSIFYTPQIVDAYWQDNPDIVADNDTIITVVPSQPGNNAFTFIAIDSFGCLHDTTFNVYVRPFPFLSNAIACDLTHTLAPSNSPNGGDYEIIEGPTPDASLSYDFIAGAVAEITASNYGIYNILFTENNCGYEAAAEIDFRPDPSILPFPADTTLCVGASIVIDAGPQLPNSDNFVINWSLNGGTFNTTDYAITANQTGTYALTITGVCGSESASTDVISINVNFAGDTICGLQAFGLVTVSPEGTGLWSSDRDGTSFSNVTGLSTSITSPTYGNVLVTYTDNRCLNDGVSRNFRYVEPPVANIIPPDPEFCLETETLILSVETTGSDAGNYLWAINGTVDPINNDSIVFPPLTFEPLVDYTVTVLVRDEFQVCPLAEGLALFEGLWCTYNIPNVITPNGDGFNDRFHVEFLEYFPNTSLHIYDRWGKMIFENGNYDQYQSSADNGGPEQGGWDGGDAESGTYFYEILLPHVRKIESGYLQILDSRSAQ